jgi:hypothetical protein
VLIQRQFGAGAKEGGYERFGYPVEATGFPTQKLSAYGERQRWAAMPNPPTTDSRPPDLRAALRRAEKALAQAYIVQAQDELARGQSQPTDQGRSNG